MPVKKIINNGAFIATLAPLLDGPEAAALSKAAIAYRDMLHWFKIEPETARFKGCDQAMLLVGWCFRGEKADPKLMAQWTEEIVSAIDELAHGNVT